MSVKGPADALNDLYKTLKLNDGCNPALSGDEARVLVAHAEEGGVTGAEAVLMGRIFNEGMTLEEQSKRGEVDTAACMEHGEDAYYMSGEAEQVLNAFFVEHGLPYGSNRPGELVTLAIGEGNADPRMPGPDFPMTTALGEGGGDPSPALPNEPGGDPRVTGPTNEASGDPSLS
jgi:hypothetical protein